MIKLLSLATVSIMLLILPRTENPDASSLGGRVTDENRVAVTSATVSARNVFSGEVESVKSDATGYRFTGLRQGRYSLFVEAEGYCSKSVFNVFLFRGKHNQLDLTLATSGKKIRTAACTEVVGRPK